jgi:hypothetical protein
MRVKWVAIVVACAVLGYGIAGCVGLVTVPFGPVVVTRLEPEAIAFLGEGGDPYVVVVGFPWTKDGYCSGQFHVSAVESATTIRVGTVVSRESRFGACAGLGTANNMAWVDLRLSLPPGDRSFVRDSDGASLPVRDRAS